MGEPKMFRYAALFLWVISPPVLLASPAFPLGSGPRLDWDYPVPASTKLSDSTPQLADLARFDYAQYDPRPTKAPQESWAQVDQAPEADTNDGFDQFEDEFGAPDKAEKSDPFEGFNRVMTSFNDRVYVYVLDPVARGWRFVVPEGGRKALGRFFDNLLYPLRLANNLLQAKVGNAAEETGRFVVNSTVGLLGLFDPAKDWLDWQAHEEDFGQTLGYWGVGPGPHLVLPFLGPSNLRDTFSLSPDWEMDPHTCAQAWEKGIPVSGVTCRNTVQSLGITVFKAVNNTSLHIGEYENLKKDAFDLYPFLRDVYEQNRIKKIAE